MSKPPRKAAAPRATEPLRDGETGELSRQAGEIEITVNGVRVAVSPELEAAVHRAYQGLAQPLAPEMTTTQAAAFLDVSRPFVIKLVKRRELPCRMVGTHRRIASQALLEYREKMFQRARAAADEMVRISQESGLCEIEGPPPKAK